MLIYGGVISYILYSSFPVSLQTHNLPQDPNQKLFPDCKHKLHHTDSGAIVRI